MSVAVLNFCILLPFQLHPEQHPDMDTLIASWSDKLLSGKLFKPSHLATGRAKVGERAPQAKLEPLCPSVSLAELALVLLLGH